MSTPTPPTPQEYLLDVMSCAERHLRHMAGHREIGPLGHHLGLYMAWWSHAYLLKAWLDADPDAAGAALAAMLELSEGVAASDGIAGDWLWQQLKAHGVNPDELEPPKCCDPPEPDSLVALTMTADAGQSFWRALAYAASRIPREARIEGAEDSHADWLEWGASRLDAALRAAGNASPVSKESQQ